MCWHWCTPIHPVWSTLMTLMEGIKLSTNVTEQTNLIYSCTGWGKKNKTKGLILLMSEINQTKTHRLHISSSVLCFVSVWLFPFFLFLFNTQALRRGVVPLAHQVRATSHTAHKLILMVVWYELKSPLITSLDITFLKTLLPINHS